jgi:hypothetical protein
MTGNSRPSDSDGHDDTEKNEDENSLPEWLEQLKVVLKVTLLLRRIVDWLVI